MDHNDHNQNVEMSVSGIPGIFSRQAWVSVGRYRWLAVLNLFLALSAVTLFAGYLCLNNRTSALGFAIGDTEEMISLLQEEKRQLNLEVLSQRSMGNVESRVADLGFVPVDKVDFVVTGHGGVALK
ncbi:hypothetical protein JW899_04875 [Candidatus Uhrbacteria bacterium]|nr:hypothetical protein [Candidatus Uhrbacteria bacterium]